MLENDMDAIVALVDEVIQNHESEAVLESVSIRVHEMMSDRPLFVK